MINFCTEPSLRKSGSHLADFFLCKSRQPNSTVRGRRHGEPGTQWKRKTYAGNEFQILTDTAILKWKLLRPARVKEQIRWDQSEKLVRTLHD